MTLTNQFVEDRRRFFLRSHQNSEKTVAFSSSVLEYTKPEMPKFELTLGPRLALGTPGCPTLQKGVCILQLIRHSVLLCKVVHT